MKTDASLSERPQCSSRYTFRETDVTKSLQSNEQKPHKKRQLKKKIEQFWKCKNTGWNNVGRIIYKRSERQRSGERDRWGCGCGE